MTDTYAANSLSAPGCGEWELQQSDLGKPGRDPGSCGGCRCGGFLVHRQAEGIYIGYKYYETRYEDAVLGQGNADAAAGASFGGAWDYAEEVTYPFGYGLSYTEFAQTLDEVSVKDDKITVTVTVTNTGDVAENPWFRFMPRCLTASMKKKIS